MGRRFAPKYRVMDMTPQQLLDWAPERMAPVIAGYCIYSPEMTKLDMPQRAVYLYMDGGVLEHNPYHSENDKQLSATAARELELRAENLGKTPIRIEREKCLHCRKSLLYCRCREKKKENA